MRLWNRLLVLRNVKTYSTFSEKEKISRTSWIWRMFCFKKLIWENETFHSRIQRNFVPTFIRNPNKIFLSTIPRLLLKFSACAINKSARVARWWRKARVHRLANFATRTEMHTTTAEYHFCFFPGRNPCFFLFVMVMTKKNQQWQSKIDQSITALWTHDWSIFLYVRIMYVRIMNGP